jgi:hypothetical protein
MAMQFDVVCNECSASYIIKHELDKRLYEIEEDLCLFCGTDNIEIEIIEDE